MIVEPVHFPLKTILACLMRHGLPWYITHACSDAHRNSQHALHVNLGWNSSHCLSAASMVKHQRHKPMQMPSTCQRTVQLQHSERLTTPDSHAMGVKAAHHQDLVLSKWASLSVSSMVKPHGQTMIQSTSACTTASGVVLTDGPAPPLPLSEQQQAEWMSESACSIAQCIPVTASCKA